MFQKKLMLCCALLSAQTFYASAADVGTVTGFYEEPFPGEIVIESSEAVDNTAMLLAAADSLSKVDLRPQRENMLYLQLCVYF